MSIVTIDRKFIDNFTISKIYRNKKFSGCQDSASGTLTRCFSW